MPSNDDTKNLNEEDKQVTKASHTVTLYLGSNDKVWYIAGLPNYDDPSCVKETTYGKDGIEKVLNEHTTEEGINPDRHHPSSRHCYIREHGGSS